MARTGTQGGLKMRDRKQAGRSKMQGRKTRDWKTRHLYTAGLENAGKGMHGKPDDVLHV